MNCQGRELIRHLRASPALACQYAITYVSNILAADDRAAEARVRGLLASADVVIAQDASSVPWLRNEAIARIVPERCRFVRLCFWRFYGYWPLPAERFHPQMWYVCDEVPAADARAYLRTDVRPSAIALNFEEQVEKFALVERNAELRMLPFFLAHHRDVKLFTDEWHPTAAFVRHVANYVLGELGLPAELGLLAEDGEDNFRHRLVLDAVSEELGLSYDQSLVKYHKTETDRETFYEYCRFARQNYDRVTPWLYPDASFREWCYARGIDDAPREVGRLGRVGTPGAPAPGRGERARPASVRDRPEPARAGPVVLWSIDLRAHREVRSVAFRFRNPGPGTEASVAVLASTDGRDWRALTVLHERMEAGAGLPRTLAFDAPVLCRHLRVEARGPARVAVEGAEVYTRVAALAPAA